MNYVIGEAKQFWTGIMGLETPTGQTGRAVPLIEWFVWDGVAWIKPESREGALLSKRLLDSRGRTLSTRMLG